MRILCFGYRSWARSIYEEISTADQHQVMIGPTDCDLDLNLIERVSPNLILFFGWSWIVPEVLTKSYTCLMLHPSALPKYRGGTPIQNQILDGITDTKLTLFKMTASVDDGPILGQRDLSLRGNITNIFERLTTLGLELLVEYLRGESIERAQKDSEATYCTRRKPEDSEITLEEIHSASAQHLFDKIRALSDPYPNAFIRTSDNKKLVIKVALIAQD